MDDQHEGNKGYQIGRMKDCALQKVFNFERRLHVFTTKRHLYILEVIFITHDSNMNLGGNKIFGYGLSIVLKLQCQLIAVECRPVYEHLTVKTATI